MQTQRDIAQDMLSESQRRGLGMLLNEAARGTAGITGASYRDLMQRGGVQHEMGKDARYTCRMREGSTRTVSPKARYKRRARASR